MTPLARLLAASGAERDVARDPRDHTLTGKCPVCRSPKMLHLVPHPDGTASAWCVSGRCSPARIIAAAGLPENEVEVSGYYLTFPHSLDLREPARVGGVVVLDRDALDSLPEPEPLIADTIDRRTVALLAGYHGTGKSFVALSWAAAIACGTPWNGREVAPGRVLYIVGEGAYGIAPRLRAWERQHSRRVPRDALRVMPQALQPTDPSAFGELLSYVEREAFDLVVVDTLARMSVGVDENDAKGMGVLVKAFDDLRRATVDGTVLLVHHTGKDRATVRGSSALEAAMDTVYMTDNRDDTSVLRRTKRKDGPVEDSIPFALHEVGDSCVWTPVVLAPAAPNPEADDERRHTTLRDAWHVLRTTWSGDAIPFTKTEAVRVMKEFGWKESTAYRHLTRLEGEGLIRDVGGRTHKFITVPDEAERLRFPRLDPERLVVLPDAATTDDLPDERPVKLSPAAVAYLAERGITPGASE